MKTAWQQALAQVESEVGTHRFNTWLKPLRLRSVEQSKLVVEVPNNFYRDRIQAQFVPILRTRIAELSGDPTVELSLQITEADGEGSLLRDLSKTKRELARQARQAPKLEGLNPRYRFDTFVVGSGNEFAHAATLAVAHGPGHTYNPLLIYGGVGLGKTHLLSAIGNELILRRPDARMVYRTAEQFMNELIHAIRVEKTAEFRNRYRETCDLLLIDDIQFLGGKERTQEEFFHTFNALYEAGKQVVLTSDEPPSTIPDLDNRLRSRFEWGLQCDIQPPDVETRVAILKKKAESHAISLPDDVALFLATHVKSNVRVLEGSLVRLAAFSSISRRSVTLELVREIFPTLGTEEPLVTVEAIQKRVATFYNLPLADLRSARRHRSVALPRQIAMYLARKITRFSFPELGSRFGGKDHTTVIHAVQKIERMLVNDSPLRRTVAALEQDLVG